MYTHLAVNGENIKLLWCTFKTFNYIDVLHVQWSTKDMDFRYRHKTTSKYVLLTREIILLLFIFPINQPAVTFYAVKNDNKWYCSRFKHLYTKFLLPATFRIVSWSSSIKDNVFPPKAIKESVVNGMYFSLFWK